MNEQVKKYIDPIKNFWGKLTKKAKIIIFSVLGGILVISLVLGIVLNQTQYVVLYAKLNNTEATDIMNELDDLNIPYKESGGTITVPSEKENTLRMQLANEGYPKSTTNYDFFTQNVNIMTTEAQRKTIEQYQLNQRLEAVIKTIGSIGDANVTITIPDTSDFAWDQDDNVSTASVAVALRTGKSLSAVDVAGIKQLVAKSVPNMKTENVAVIDKSTGSELSSQTSSANTQVDISQFKLEIQKQYENDMKKKILTVLQPLYGAQGVYTTVTCTMDLDKTIKENITYTPSMDNKGVTQKETKETQTTTSGASSVGGVAGATPNTGATSTTVSATASTGSAASSTSSATSTTSATGTTSSSAAGGTTTYPGITMSGNTIYSTNNESYEYLVSKMTQQVQSDAASVKNLSVAVVIDEAAMTDDKKTKISDLVAKAASIDAANVTVYNSKFKATSSPAKEAVSPGLLPGINTTTMIIGGSVLGVLLIAMIALMITASKRKKKMRMMLAGLNEEGSDEDEESGGEDEEVEAPFEEISTENIGENFGSGDKKAPITIDDIQSHRDSLDSRDEALKKELHDFSSQNPEIAAQLIRTWLRGEDDKHG